MSSVHQVNRAFLSCIARAYAIGEQKDNLKEDHLIKSEFVYNYTIQNLKAIGTSINNNTCNTISYFERLGNSPKGVLKFAMVLEKVFIIFLMKLLLIFINKR